MRKTIISIFFSIAVSLSATAAAMDYDTTFVTPAMEPLAQMHESFDNAKDYRNKTLKLEGWQNLCFAGDRAWWGFSDDDITGTAKVTGYVWGGTKEEKLISWLITPPLKYDVEHKMFTFNVQGNQMYNGQNGFLAVYYIDATTPDDPYFERIEALDTIIPSHSTELNGKWYPIYLSLEGLQNAPESFMIGFCYQDMKGSNGTTYYIDDVTWGEPVGGVDGITAVTARPKRSAATKYVKDGKLFINKNGRVFSVSGVEVRQ